MQTLEGYIGLPRHSWAFPNITLNSHASHVTTQAPGLDQASLDLLADYFAHGGKHIPTTEPARTRPPEVSDGALERLARFYACTGSKYIDHVALSGFYGCRPKNA